MIKKVILLVEDNSDDVELTRIALEENQIAIQLDVARDGVEALDYLLGRSEAKATQAVSGLPHLVLLDLKLPKIDGLEVLRRLRSEERTKLLPVVVLTSSLEERDLVQSYLLGANSYIRKPVDFGQFVDVVSKLGLYWLIINHAPQGGI